MFRRKVYASASLLIATATLLVSGAVPAMAAATSSTSATGGNGLRISPVRSDLTINPGSSQTIDVYVQNITNASANLQGVIDDFTAGSNETGTPEILLNGEPAPSHSLKNFVSPI